MQKLLCRLLPLKCIYKPVYALSVINGANLSDFCPSEFSSKNLLATFHHQIQTSEKLQKNFGQYQEWLLGC